mgnify:CR=1 FL=1
MNIRDLYSNGIIKSGKFTLKSGVKSNYYVDMKKAISKPHLVRKITEAFENNIKGIINKNTVICGVPYGAIPYAAFLSYKTGVPLIMIRNDIKDYGTKQLIEGNYDENTEVILIEDVITTGSSVIDCAAKLEQHGVKIVKLISIVSRYTAVVSLCPYYRKKHPIESLIQIPEIDKKQNVIDVVGKKGKLCVAADVKTTQELIELVEKIGSDICILKLHIDIIEDFGENTIQCLLKLKETFNFLIWEDRKFADIASIVKEQIHGGVYKISSWVDLVSMHLISGPEILSQAGNCGIIAITNMSTMGTLADEEYQRKCLEYIEGNDNVVGIVSQIKIDDNYNLLQFVPGINISSKKTDNLGQQYGHILQKDWADVYIVGRDIVQNEDPSLKIKEYKKF